MLRKTEPHNFDDPNEMFTIGGSRHGLLQLDYTKQIGIHEEWFDNAYIEYESHAKFERQRNRFKKLGKQGYLDLEQLMHEPTSDSILLLRQEYFGDNDDDEEGTEDGSQSTPSQLSKEKTDTSAAPVEVSFAKKNLDMMLKLLGKSADTVTSTTVPKNEVKQVKFSSNNDQDDGDNNQANDDDDENDEIAHLNPLSRDNTNNSSFVARSFTDSTVSVGRMVASDLLKVDGQSTSMGSAHSQRHTSMDDNDEKLVVIIEKLERGQVFGFTHMLHDNQPDVSLMTENGVELFVLDRELFRSYANDKLLTDMAKDVMFKLVLVGFFCFYYKFVSLQISPYPSDKQLQYRLQTFCDWEQFKKNVLDETLKTQMNSNCNLQSGK